MSWCHDKFGVGKQYKMRTWWAKEIETVFFAGLEEDFAGLGSFFLMEVTVHKRSRTT